MKISYDVVTGPLSLRSHTLSSHKSRELAEAWLHAMQILHPNLKMCVAEVSEHSVRAG